IESPPPSTCLLRLPDKNERSGGFFVSPISSAPRPLLALLVTAQQGVALSTCSNWKPASRSNDQGTRDITNTASPPYQRRSFPVLTMASDPERVCYVQVTEEMKEKELALSNALIASQINSSAPTPTIQAVRIAVQTKFDASTQPTKIESFPPDYILYFPTPAIKQAALSYGIIQGPNFVLRLSPWTREYRCQKIAYNTLVAVDIKGIPPQAAVRDSLDTALLPHCNIQCCSFDEDTGICTAIGYAHDPATIPTKRTLGLSYSHGEQFAVSHLNSMQAFTMNRRSKQSHSLQKTHLKAQTSPMHQTTMIQNSLRI
ncbi:unnamed protein product, partial [Urochloa humidicola]